MWHLVAGCILVCSLLGPSAECHEHLPIFVPRQGGEDDDVARPIVREGKAVHLNAVAVLRCFWSRAALVEGQTDGIEVRAPYER